MNIYKTILIKTFFEDNGGTFSQSRDIKHDS